jgi:hypothetical protein
MLTLLPLHLDVIYLGMTADQSVNSVITSVRVLPNAVLRYFSKSLRDNTKLRHPLEFRRSNFAFRFFFHLYAASVNILSAFSAN